MVLFLDNYDSFSYNLIDYLSQAGVDTEIVKNDQIDLTAEIPDLKGMVISPGPGRPADAGKLMSVLAQYASIVPILGICLGHQAIGEFFGSRLVHAQVPMHGKISTVHLTDHYLFENMPKTIKVTRYHSLLIDQAEGPLKAIAKSGTDEVMALAHHKLPIVGVQFHPEAVLTEYGLQIIKNWAEYNNIVS